MMATYCHNDMQNNTRKNIFLICDEFGFSLDTISLQGVKEAYQPHPVLPDNQFMLNMLQEMLEERLQTDIE